MGIYLDRNVRDLVHSAPHIDLCGESDGVSFLKRKRSLKSPAEKNGRGSGSGFSLWRAGGERDVVRRTLSRRVSSGASGRCLGVVDDRSKESTRAPSPTHTAGRLGKSFITRSTRETTAAVKLGRMVLDFAR